MASIRFGAGIVDARGSISGQTFSRNASGAYIRARTAPTNPSTPRQGAVRALFGALSTGWKALTEVQRKSWIDAAQATLGEYTNRLGEAAHYTGQQLFMSLNGVIQQFGGTTLATAPSPVEIPSVAVSDAAGTVTTGALATLGLTIGLPGGLATADLLVYASAPVSAGKARPESVSYRLIDTPEDQSAGALDVLSAYSTVFGSAAAVGDAIWFRVVPADATTGQTNAPLHQVAVLTAGE